MQAVPKQQRSSSAHEHNKVHDFIIEQDFEEANNRSLFATFRFLSSSAPLPLKESPQALFSNFQQHRRHPYPSRFSEVVLLSPMNWQKEPDLVHAYRRPPYNSCDSQSCLRVIAQRVIAQYESYRTESYRTVCICTYACTYFVVLALTGPFWCPAYPSWSSKTLQPPSVSPFS